MSEWRASDDDGRIADDRRVAALERIAELRSRLAECRDPRDCHQPDGAS